MNSNGHQKTREKNTEKLYRLTALRVFSAFYSERIQEWTAEGGYPFTDWLPRRYLAPGPDQRPLSKASWRLYRAALVFAANQQGYPEIAARIALIAGGVKKSMRQGRVKHLKPADWEQMLQLVRERSDMPGTLILFLQASMLTGLRPSEWQRAELVCLSDKPALLVQNAKQSNGRSHGQTRTIVLAGMSQSAIDLIGRQIDHVHQKLLDLGSWTALYLQLKFSLRHAIRERWPDPIKRPTLYIARHLFAANAKAAGRSKEEVAALMGHASDETATQHYGRRRFGDRRMHQVEPYGPDIERVRKASRTYREKLATRSITGTSGAVKAQFVDNTVSPND